MELSVGNKCVFYLRLMKLLLSMMRLLLQHVCAHWNEMVFEVLCRIIVVTRLMIGCCQRLFENKENYMISLFLESML